MMTTMYNGNYINQLAIMISMTRIIMMAIMTGMILTMISLMWMQMIPTHDKEKPDIMITRILMIISIILRVVLIRRNHKITSFALMI